jgi:hypothetical protein
MTTRRASMTLFRSAARRGLIVIALCFSACGGSEEEDNAGGQNCVPLAPARGQVFEGDLFLLSPTDVDAAQQYSEITGSLQLQATSEPLDVELPQLRRLGGGLSADSTKLRRFVAPRLESVGSQLWFYLNHDLVEIDLRNLTTVGAQVSIHRNLGLRVLQLDALVSAGEGGSLLLNRNLQLPDCFLDVLDQRFILVRTDAPECICTRSCGLIEAHCP